jgi:hypothetical protein
MKVAVANSAATFMPASGRIRSTTTTKPSPPRRKFAALAACAVVSFGAASAAEPFACRP